jgi:DNA polymerase-3 subunit epsilon
MSRTLPALPDGHWARNGFVVLDTETTGTDVETAEVASISCGLVGQTSSDADVIVTTEYIAVDMPEEASAVNHLTTEILAKRATRPAAEVLGDFVDMIGKAMAAGMPVVIANAPYDLTVLDRDCRRHGVTPLTVAYPVVDPIVLDKRAVKYRRRVSDTQGARQLKTLCQVHGVGWDDELAHTSEYDALQAGRVVWQILRGFPALARMSLAELHSAQVDWYAEQSEGLAGWFESEARKWRDFGGQARRAGDQVGADEAAVKAAEFNVKAGSVDLSWPVRPVPAEVVSS